MSMISFSPDNNLQTLLHKLKMLEINGEISARERLNLSVILRFFFQNQTEYIAKLGLWIEKENLLMMF